MADYPDTTLYRSPTQDDIARRTAAAQALPTLTAGGPYAGAYNGMADFAGDIARRMSSRGGSTAESNARAAALKASQAGGPDMGADTGNTSAYGPRLVPVGVVPHDTSVPGVTQYTDAQGRTTFTNMGNAGYADLQKGRGPANALPSVAGFLQGVRNMYGGASGVTNGGVPAPRYGAPSLSDRVSGMYDQYNQLMQKGDTQSLILAAGLRKHLANLTSAASGAEYGQGQLALGAGHLGVAAGQLGVQQGQLGLQRQTAYYSNTLHKGILDKLTGDKPDVEGARALAAIGAGQNPDPQSIIPTPLGGYVHSLSQGSGAPVIQKDGTTRFVPDQGQYPAYPAR